MFNADGLIRLRSSYHKDMRVGGILYLHDITRDHHPGSLLARDNLPLITKICRNDTLAPLAVVTTKWDRLRDIAEGEDRLEELKEEFWNHALERGAQVYRLEPSDGEGNRISNKHRLPWEIISQVLASESQSHM